MTTESFTQRMMEMEKTLYHVAYGMLYNRSDCKDAVQECILKAWQKRAGLKSEASFRPWVIRILINECNNMLRARRRCLPMEEMPESPAPPDADPWLHDAPSGRCRKSCGCPWCSITWKALRLTRRQPSCTFPGER